MTVEEIKTFLSEHQDEEGVKELVASMQPKLSAERVNELLSDSETFKLFEPHITRAIDKAIKTHDEKRAPDIQKRIEEAKELASKEAKMTEEERAQVENQKTAKELAELKSQLARRDMISELHKEAAKRNVPLELAVDLDNPSLTLDRAIERMDAYAEKNKAVIEKEINEHLTRNAHKPGSGSGGENNKGFDYSAVDWSNPEQRNAAIAAAEKDLKSAG